MTYNVRVPLWFPLLLGLGMLMFSGMGFTRYAVSGDEPLLFFAVWPLFGAVMAVLLRNMATLKVKPDLVVSRLQHQVVKMPLRQGERLQVHGYRLYLRRFDGTWREIPLNTALLRESDWQEFSEAVARRWPPNG